MKMEGGTMSLSGSISDDSQGKLIIDCNKWLRTRRCSL